jgi:hypothetical protein
MVLWILPLVLAASSPANLHVLQGSPVNPYFFGWDLEQWGLELNLSFADTAGLALTEALHPGVLRYPGGTGANIWDYRKGRYLPPPPGAPTHVYDRWKKFYPWINDFPEGTFSAEAFLQGLGGKSKRVVWDLNVYVYNTTEACDQIKYIAGLPGQQEEGVLLELGNELYTDAQGLPKFPNVTAYAEAMLPIVACARKLMPRAKIGACGCANDSYNSSDVKRNTWNPGLRPYLHHFDGVSLHHYRYGVWCMVNGVWCTVVYCSVA